MYCAQLMLLSQLEHVINVFGMELLVRSASQLTSSTIQMVSATLVLLCCQQIVSRVVPIQPALLALHRLILLTLMEHVNFAALLLGHTAQLARHLQFVQHAQLVLIYRAVIVWCAAPMSFLQLTVYNVVQHQEPSSVHYAPLISLLIRQVGYV